MGGLRNRCEHSSKARMQAFQAWNAGSIPAARTKYVTAEYETVKKFWACAGVGEPGQTVNLLSYDWGGSNPPTPTRIKNAPLRCVFYFGLDVSVVFGNTNEVCLVWNVAKRSERGPSDMLHGGWELQSTHQTSMFLKSFQIYRFSNIFIKKG